LQKIELLIVRLLGMAETSSAPKVLLCVRPLEPEMSWRVPADAVKPPVEDSSKSQTLETHWLPWPHEMVLAGGPPQVQLAAVWPLQAAHVEPEQTYPPEHVEPAQHAWLKPPQAAQVVPTHAAPLPQVLPQQG
jgi:hypothetical protein